MRRITLLTVLLGIVVLVMPTYVQAQPPGTPPGQGGQVQALNQKIDQEIADRIADVDAEEAARIAADATLQSNIDAEEAARIAADATLQSNIDGLANPLTTDENTMFIGSDHDSDQVDSEISFGTDDTELMTLYENGDLDVSGNVTLGSNALPAASGEEAFRIIRGYVESDGSIIAGQGFTVTRVAVDGYYIIDFDSPFPGAPSLDTQPTPIATPLGGGHINAAISGIGWLGFDVQLFNTTTLSNEDARFFFIVIGPR